MIDPLVKRMEIKREAIKYKGGKCENCDLETDHLSLYVFHHTAPGDKRANISLMIRNGATWTTLKKELDKCELLCHSCHSKRHTRTQAIESFRCPRCLNKDFTLFRRGTLTDDSTFLPREIRGTRRAVKVPVRCLFCGYTWRSTSGAVELLQEEPTHGEKEEANP
jgi:hypothetical protein